MALDPSNLPSQTDLNSLMGAWNPMSYMQGFQNQGLADQFRQQAYADNANQIDKGTLENTQSAAMNPMLVQQQQGVNAGRDITNQSAGLDLASKQGTFQDKQALLHSQIAREMSDEELTSESNRIGRAYQQALVNKDTDAIAKYGPAMDTLVGALQAKASDRLMQRQMEQQKINAGITEAGIGANATTNAAGIHVGGQTAAALIGEQGKITAATLHQNLANGLQEELKKPESPERNRNVARYIQAMQTTSPGYGPALNVAPQTGFNRMGQSSNMSDADLIKLYGGK